MYFCYKCLIRYIFYNISMGAHRKYLEENFHVKIFSKDHDLRVGEYIDKGLYLNFNIMGIIWIIDDDYVFLVIFQINYLVYIRYGLRDVKATIRQNSA